MKTGPGQYPPGALYLYSSADGPDTWTVDFETRGLVYREKRIPACGNMQTPYGFELRAGRSATTLIFREQLNYPQTEDPHLGPDKGPYRFYIEMKTWEQPTRTGESTALNINNILGAAYENQVVAQGLIVTRVIRAAGVGADFDYAQWMGCIAIISSD